MSKTGILYSEMKHLEHVILYELIVLPYQNAREQKLATLNRPLHYTGVFLDLKTFVRSGMFLLYRSLLYTYTRFHTHFEMFFQLPRIRSALILDHLL